MLPPRARLGLCVFTLVMYSFVLNAVQFLARPLDWVGLRPLRLHITGAYHNSVGVAFVFWLEYAAGVEIRITGDVLPPGERVLFICNHVAVEWMHIICLAHKVSNAGAFKTIMKESLKYVPIAWAAVLEGHITVKRAQGKAVREATVAATKAQAAQLCRDGMPLWIVLFPEGTWLKPGEESIKDKANDFARQNGFPELHNVLFPRTAGFVALLEEVRKPEHCLDAVYDVTVAYNRPYHPTRIGTEKPPNVVKLASGGPSAPKEVHFNVRRHVLPTGIPAGEAGAAKWLQNAYAVDKEALLDEFHASDPHRFPGPDRSIPLDLSNVLGHMAFLTASLGVMLVGIDALFGRTTVLVFFGFGALAAVVAATGDADINPALVNAQKLAARQKAEQATRKTE